MIPKLPEKSIWDTNIPNSPTVTVYLLLDFGRTMERVGGNQKC